MNSTVYVQKLKQPNNGMFRVKGGGGTIKTPNDQRLRGPVNIQNVGHYLQPFTGW